LPADATFATVAVKSANNGDAVISATATIGADKILTPSTAGATVQGLSDVTVMLCKLPWPTRATDGSWVPYSGTAGVGDNNYHFAFYYCRDGNLHALKSAPVIPANTAAFKISENLTLDQYLFTYDSPTLSLAGDGIGCVLRQIRCIKVRRLGTRRRALKTAFLRYGLMVMKRFRTAGRFMLTRR